MISRKDNRFKKGATEVSTLYEVHLVQLEKNRETESQKLVLLLSLRYVLTFLTYSLSWELFLQPKIIVKTVLSFEIWAIRLPWHIRSSSIVHFLYRRKYRVCSPREWPKSSASWECSNSPFQERTWGLRSTAFYIYFWKKENNNREQDICSFQPFASSGRVKTLQCKMGCNSVPQGKEWLGSRSLLCGWLSTSKTAY